MKRSREAQSFSWVVRRSATEGAERDVAERRVEGRGGPNLRAKSCLVGSLESDRPATRELYGYSAGLRKTLLPHGALQLEGEEFVGLGSEFHWQLVEHIAAEAAHHHRHRLLKADAAALEIKELIF